jgi:hypothetical protein
VPEKGLQIQLDPFNPGQFFACCGLFELMSIDEPGLLSRFVLEPRMPRKATFCVDTVRGAETLTSRLEWLRTAQVTFPDEGLDASIRTAVVHYGDFSMEIDWWLDEFRAKTTNIKCWAGQVTTQRLFSELFPLVDVASGGGELFERHALSKSKFGIDPRSAWNTLDLGFSPDAQGVAGTIFPAVEVLGVFGLQFFRPGSANRSAVRYSLWKDALPASVARVAFVSPWDGMQRTDLVFEICKRGQSYKYFSFAKNFEKENQ